MSDIVKHDMIRNDMLPGTLRPPCPRYLPHVHSPSASQLPWRTEALLVGCWGKTILPQQHEAAQGLSTVPSVLSAVHRLVWPVFVVSTKTMKRQGAKLATAAGACFHGLRPRIVGSDPFLPPGCTLYNDHVHATQSTHCLQSSTMLILWLPTLEGCCSRNS